MASTQLRIRKDLYWLIPSSITDNTASVSSITNSFYSKIDRATSGGTATYINCNAGYASYFFRLDSIMSIPTSVQIKLKYRMFNYDATLPNGVTVIGNTGGRIEFKINNVTIGTITDSTDADSVQDQTFSLTPTQAAEILHTRNSPGYHYYELKFNLYNTDTLSNITINQSARIYAVEIYFNNNDGETYNRTESYIGYTGTFSSSSAFLTSGQGFINSSGSTSGYGESRNFILGTTSGSAPDGTFIYSLNNSGNYLPIIFNPITGYKVFEKVTRADLYLRYHNPVASGSNYTDSFNVYGINNNFPKPVVIWGPGQFLSGSSGFYTVSSELTWLDNTASGTSGNNASAYFKSIESLSNAEYRIYGIPSGGRISAAELIVRTEDSSYIPFHILSSVVSGHSDSSGYYTNTGRNLYRGNIDKDLFNKGYFPLEEYSGYYTYGTNSSSATLTSSSGLILSKYWTYNKGSLPGASKNAVNYRNALLIDNANINKRDYIQTGFNHNGDETLYFHFTKSGSWNKLTQVNDNIIYYQTVFGNSDLLALSDGINITFKTNSNFGPVNLTGPIFESTQVLFVRRSSGNQFANMSTLELYTGPANELLTLRDQQNIQVSNRPIYDSSVYFFGRPNGGFDTPTAYMHDFGFSSSGWSNSDIDLFNRSRHELGYWISNSGSDYVHYYLKNVSGAYSGYANNDSCKMYFNPGMESLYEIDETEFDYSFLRNSPSGVYIELNYSSSGTPASISGVYELYNDGQKYQLQMSGVCTSGNNLTKKIYPYTFESRPFEKTLPDTVFHFFDFDIAYPYGSGIYDIDFKLHNIKVGIDAWNRIPYDSGNIDFYQGSATPESGNINLYIGQNYDSGNINFFVSNKVEDLSLNFYTYGLAPNSGNINFYTVNYTNEPSGINFNISGAYVNYNSLDLFLDGGTPVQQNANIGLSVNSAFNMNYDGSETFYFVDSSGNFIVDSSGNFITTGLGSAGLQTKYIPFYIESNVDPEKNLNLFLKSDTGTRDAVVYFTISGEYEKKVIDFYLKNTSSGNEKAIKLYTYGGNIPDSGTLNMFIGRDGEGEFKYLNMTLGTDKYNTNDLDFYMFGAFAESGVINMYVSGKEIQNNRFNLFMGGF